MTGSNSSLSGAGSSASERSPIAVFGIGNPLIDVVIQARDEDLTALSLDKGIMHLVTGERQQEILTYFGDAERTLLPGGSAPNTLIALAGLGVPAVVCGKIGDDDFGKTYNEQVASYGITSRLITGDGATGSSIILVTPDGERTMNTHLGMCQEFGVGDLDEALLRRSQYLYFTGYMWDTEVQKAAIRRAIEVAHDSGVTIAFDLADPFAVERYRDDFLDLLEHSVDIVFANRAEARILYGTEDSHEAVRALCRSTAIAVLKVGRDGSVVAERTLGARSGSSSSDVPVITSVQGRPIQAVDSTGAGDMFAAGFLSALARGKGAVAAARSAGWLAEEIIQRVGAQFSVEHIRALRAEIDAAIAR